MEVQNGKRLVLPKKHRQTSSAIIPDVIAFKIEIGNLGALQEHFCQLSRPLISDQVPAKIETGETFAVAVDPCGQLCRPHISDA